MANTVTVQKIADGPRNACFVINLASDGSTGDLSGQKVVDISTLSGSPTDLAIKRVTGNLTGFSATLEWDATTAVQCQQIPAENQMDEDYSDLGYLTNNAGAGKTGSILLNTAGFSAATDLGTIRIEVVKRY